MTVADRIINRRIELGMTQTELAKKAGYSDKTSISKIENSGDDISTKKIYKMAKALDTTFAYLMGWDEPKPDYTVKVDDGLSNLIIEIETLYQNSNKEKRDRIIRLLDMYIKALKED